MPDAAPATEPRRRSDHLASGVVPVIDRTVDLEHIPDAIRDLAAGRIAGKAAS